MRTLVGLLLALVLAVPAAAQTGRVSTGNSTTALLGSGATFTGAWEDATQAAVVVVTIKADQISATNGVKVEFSSDCSNQDYVTTHSFTDTVNGQSFADATAAKCVRVEYVNGASGQATFRLQTVVRDSGFGGSAGGGTASSVTINDPSVTTQKAAVNASGQLSITCANCSGSGASAVDRSTFTFGTTSGAPSGGVFDDTPPTGLTAGMFAVPRVTANRAFHVNFRNQAGTEIGTAATPIQVSLANTAANATAVKVDGSAVTQPVSGTVAATESGTWTVQPGNTANTTAWKVDGSAVTQPVSGTVAVSTAFLLDATYTGRMPAGASPADAESNTNTALSRIGLFHFIFNGTSWDRVRGAANALNSTGTGIPTAQIVGQFDDVAPTAITENQFGNLRMSTNRNLYGTIRDAAGNERGANVSAGNALLVDASATTQPISAAALPLPTGAATETTLGTRLADATYTGRTPAGASPADAETNTSTALSRSGAYPFVFNGTTWDRLRGDTTNGAFVNVKNMIALPAGSALIGEVAAVTTATTTDALSTCYLTSAATTNATNCKASAGNVYAIHVTNTTTTNYFLRTYNLATAPTCSSATGFVETIPALGAAANGGVNGRINGAPQAYSTGIGFCLTGGGTSTDNTNAAVGVYITIEYKLED